MRNQEEICRLCFKICNNFKVIEGNAKYALDVLLPKIDLAAIQKPVMCSNCEEQLMKCFEFKMACLHTRDCIVPFAFKDAVKVDVKDVYLSKNEGSTGIPEDHGICLFCMNSVKSCFAIPLSVEVGDIILKNMIEQCLPELDFSVVKKPIICPSCHESLKNCYHFVTSCLIVEENIKKYYENLDVHKGQIEINGLLQYTIGDGTTNHVDGNLVDVVKVEEGQLCEERGVVEERVFKLEPMFCDYSEDAKEVIEHEIKSFMDEDEMKFHKEAMFTSTCEEENNKPYVKIEQAPCAESRVKEENVCEIEDQKCLPYEEIKIKTDFNRFEDGIILQQSEATTTLHREPNCVMPKLKGNASIPYNKKNYLVKTVSLMTTYQCKYCSYETNYKRCIKIHLLKHTDLSDVTLYKCDSCSYQTVDKSNLQSHLLLHKNLSEVTMYKCSSCSYEVNNHHKYKIHLLKHEVTTYKCDSCTFQTQVKYSLRMHMMLHLDPSKVATYKCDSCSYQTLNKHYLKRHSLSHEDPSQRTTYKCDSCSYQTKVKYNLRMHILMLHQDPSKVAMYKCDSCSFQSRGKRNLKRHLLQHKDPSEFVMHKCNFCSYQTRDKKCLKVHSLRHEDPSVIPMHKCDSCSFQTKRKFDLKRHSLRWHKVASDK